jgi:hypothetical protein
MVNGGRLQTEENGRKGVNRIYWNKIRKSNHAVSYRHNHAVSESR